MEKSKFSAGFRLPRRRILRWLGLSALSTMIFRIVPIKKMVSKEFLRKGDQKISISINKYAVKRNGKVTKNG